jgi:preprotein translocase SecE subunit
LPGLGSAATSPGSDLADILTFAAARSRKLHLLSAHIGYPTQLLIPETRARLAAHPWKRVGRKRAVRIPEILTTDADHQTMAFSPFKFLQEVRTETAKVTWPTRRETVVTTIMVFVMVAFASAFFFVADMIIRFVITFLLGIH